MRIEEYAKIGMDFSKVKVGVHCTVHWYSDAKPCTITRVSPSGKTFWAKRNKTKLVGECYSQDWEISEETKGEEFKVTWRRNGVFRTANWTKKEREEHYAKGEYSPSISSDLYVSVGQWHKYYDWEF